MGYLSELFDYVADSFSNLFNLEPDESLSEPENVEKVIDQTATVAAITSMVLPIPAADFVVLTPIQAKMALHIGTIKGFDVSQERAQEIVTEILGVLGMSLTANLLIVSLTKLIPIVGGVLTVPLIYAATWGIGKVVDYYFDCLRAGNKPSSETMKDLFAEQFKVGKKRGEDLDTDSLKRQADDLRRRVEARGEDLRTETRMDGSAAAGRTQAGSSGAAADRGGKRKITITLPDKAEQARNPAVDQTDLPPPMRKTIGPLGQVKVTPKGEEPAAEPEATVEPRGATAKKTVGEATPPLGTPEAPGETSEPAAQGSSDGAENSLIDRLERLARLREQGILTADEFAEAKRKLLG
jgi:uncharacterized protein (DUF697 family)